MNETKLKIPGENDFFTQEAYKTLRTNLQFCGQDIHAIMVTSCSENEGKTTVSLGLGKSMAELGKKVFVIDADMRKSVIAGRNADVRFPAGLSEVITGQESLDNCLYATQYPNLTLMFSGQYPPNPVELLSGRYFDALIAGSRKTFDYIIIDTPPLGSVIDAAVIAPKCDGAILVISDQSVGRRLALDVVNQLKKSECPILGVVRNNVKKKNDRYYYKKYY